MEKTFQGDVDGEVINTPDQWPNLHSHKRKVHVLYTCKWKLLHIETKLGL